MESSNNASAAGDSVSGDAQVSGLLEEFHEAQKKIKPELWRDFESCFVGALSGRCQPKVWRQALAIANTCMKAITGL